MLDWFKQNGLGGCGVTVVLRRPPLAAVGLGGRAHDCGPERSLRTAPLSSSLSPSATAFRFPRAHRGCAPPARPPPGATDICMGEAARAEGGERVCVARQDRLRGQPVLAYALAVRRESGAARGWRVRHEGDTGQAPRPFMSHGNVNARTRDAVSKPVAHKLQSQFHKLQSHVAHKLQNQACPRAQRSSWPARPRVSQKRPPARPPFGGPRKPLPPPVDVANHAKHPSRPSNAGTKTS